MNSKHIVFLICMILVSYVSAQNWNVPDGIDVPGGENGSGVSVDPVSSMVKQYIVLTCEDSRRNAMDGADPRVVAYENGEFYDGTEVVEEYQHLFPHDFMVKPNPGPIIGMNMWAENPEISLPVDLSDPRFLRWEGPEEGCVSFYKQTHDRYYASDFRESYGDGWKAGDFKYSVDWDNNPSDCTTIGGDWGDLGCCGDDYIWVYNNPIHYAALGQAARMERAEENELCLYSDTPSYGNAIDGESYGFGTDSYFCDYETMGHIAYDPMLQLDDDNFDVGNRTMENFFIGKGESETDIGKWTIDGKSRYCHVSFDQNSGPSFKWISVLDAANMNQAICELVLGYEWTGTKCCGVPGNPSSYNDAETECDAEEVMPQVSGTNGSVNPMTFVPRFQDACDASRTTNRVCYIEEAVDNDTIFPADEDKPYIENLYNLNGEILVCDGADNLGGFDTVSKCGIRGVFDDFAICTYMNDSWYKKVDTHTYDVLGYRSGDTTIEDVKQKLHHSTIPSVAKATSLVDTECCFNNACFAGDRCVDEGMVYEYYNGNWQEYDNKKKEGAQVYICSKGDWQGPMDMQFDWVYNTDSPWYCMDDFQCFCREGDCRPESIENGCTVEPYYFEGDHFCENREWTSRTRLIANQLINMARGDYTLFCDTPEKTINYHEPFTQANVNHVCVLNEDGKVTIGVSFNTEEDSFDAKYYLLDPTVGFIPIVLGEEIDNCDNAIYSISSGYGIYKACSGSKIYYNNRTQSLIYSEEPIGSFQTYDNNQLRTYLDEITSYIDSQNIDIPNIHLLGNARSFDTIYMARQGSGIVFGIVEEIYDDDRGDIRYFMAVQYKGISVDCEQVSKAYDDAFCGHSGQDSYVIDKRVDDSFKFWTDLTAKLRYR